MRVEVLDQVALGDDGDLIDDAGRDDLELDALVTTLDSVIALPALPAEFSTVSLAFGTHTF